MKPEKRSSVSIFTFHLCPFTFALPPHTILFLVAGLIAVLYPLRGACYKCSKYCFVTCAGLRTISLRCSYNQARLPLALIDPSRGHLNGNRLLMWWVVNSGRKRSKCNAPLTGLLLSSKTTAVFLLKEAKNGRHFTSISFVISKAIN